MKKYLYGVAVVLLLLSGIGSAAGTFSLRDLQTNDIYGPFVCTNGATIEVDEMLYEVSVVMTECDRALAEADAVRAVELREKIQKEREARAVEMAARKKLKASLHALVFPRVSLQNTPLSEIARWLQSEGRKLSDDKLNLNIVIGTAQYREHKLTIDLTNVTAFDLVRYIARVTKLEYEFLDNRTIVFFHRVSTR